MLAHHKCTAVANVVGDLLSRDRIGRLVTLNRLCFSTLELQCCNHVMQYAFSVRDVSATKVFIPPPSHVAIQFTFLPWLIRSTVQLLLAVSEPPSSKVANTESLGRPLDQSQMRIAASFPPEIRCRPFDAL